jgi:hypothetical protein
MVIHDGWWNRYCLKLGNAWCRGMLGGGPFEERNVRSINKESPFCIPRGHWTVSDEVSGKDALVVSLRWLSNEAIKVASGVGTSDLLWCEQLFLLCHGGYHSVMLNMGARLLSVENIESRRMFFEFHDRTVMSVNM